MIKELTAIGNTGLLKLSIEIPMLGLISGAGALFILLLVIFLIVRKKKKAAEESEDIFEEAADTEAKIEAEEKRLEDLLD